jgi:hypothetical protein
MNQPTTNLALACTAMSQAAVARLCVVLGKKSKKQLLN